MPATYSISVGGPTEALRKQDIISVLLDLPDNTQKLISPKDVRDAFLTSWANSAFKQTIGQAGIEYLGIDSGNPDNRDIKQKIFLGKRNFTGSDIMNNTLLNDSSNDIYIYNTKSDSSLTQSTTVAILAGTNSSLHIQAPYIQSNVINSGYAVDLNIVNPSIYSGPINIYSNTGRVAVNGISFPTVAETSASASNGKILKYSGSYPNGILRWAEPTVTIANIGTPGSVTNIYGSPSNINGYSLEFVDNNIVAQTVGGIPIGSSFSSGSYLGQNWPLSEVIRKILYPYVPPVLSLTVANTINGTTYFSTGVTHSINFNYSITRYSNKINAFQITGTTYSSSFMTGFTSSVGQSFTASFTQSVYSNSTSGITQSYVLRVDDTPYTTGYSHSATASIRFITPFFYGFNSTNIDLYGPTLSYIKSQVGTFINSANSIVYPYLGSSQVISADYNGSGYIYFLVPSSYPHLSKIKDPNGFILHDSSNLGISSFTYSGLIDPTGANGIATGTTWRVYKTIGTCSYIGGGYVYPGPLGSTGSGNFEFIF